MCCVRVCVRACVRACVLCALGFDSKRGTAFKEQVREKLTDSTIRPGALVCATLCLLCVCVCVCVCAYLTVYVCLFYRNKNERVIARVI